MVNRRDLRKTAGTVSAAVALGRMPWLRLSAAEPSAAALPAPSWVDKPMRWAQLTLLEDDPGKFDPQFWFDYFKRTKSDAVCLSAGGCVAYYPTKVPFHHRSAWLGKRDLFGELIAGCRKLGMVVIARTDPHATYDDAREAHPNWIAVDAAGKPRRAGELYVTCVNSPYYEEYLPSVLREIIERTHPEGITDNCWSGLGRESICHCENCSKKFKERSGKTIPRNKNWDDPIYMNGGSISGQCRSFRDYKEICRRAEIIMLDHQARSESAGFQQNAEAGKLIHGLLGWDKLIPESMAMYQAAGSSAQVAQPVGVKRLRITKVHTVEIRGVPAGKGLVLPWDAKKTPLDTRDYVVTQFLTDQGIIGMTMDGGYSLPEGIGRMVQERAEAYFVGKDPLDIELHNAQFFQKQKAPVRLFFLEVGLWDLVGKVCGQPLYKLWGAHSEKVRAYAATVHFDRTPAQRAEDALRFCERGFRAIKLRMHHDRPADDLALVAAVREAVGDKMAIMVDANQAGKTAKSPPPVWDYNRALTMAKELEQMSVYWLEEPLNRDALELGMTAEPCGFRGGP